MERRKLNKPHIWAILKNKMKIGLIGSIVITECYGFTDKKKDEEMFSEESFLSLITFIYFFPFVNECTDTQN